MRRFKDPVLTLLSAALLVLPFHFGELGFLAYFAFLPYFFFFSDKRPGDALKASFILGCLFYLFLGRWLMLVSVPGFFALAAYLGLYFAVFGYFSVYFLNADSPKPLFYIPSFWVLLEFLRGWVIGGLPWSLLAYSQWRYPLLIQIADITGAYGVSFFVMLVNLALFKIAGGWKKLKRPPIDTLAALAVASFIVITYGAASLAAADSFYKSSREKAVLRVSVLQGNIPQDQKWNTRIKNIIFEKYKRLTFMSAIEKSDLIIWPETSFPGYLEDEPVLAAQLRGAARQSNTHVLVGAPTMGDIERGLRFFNSAILYGPDGEERKRYNKVHLVPFGEYIPLEFVLGFLRNLYAIGHFTAGEERTVFSVVSRYQPKPIRAQFGVLICFEDIFPDLVRDFKQNGADFLVNITNDAWFGRTTAPYQHAQASIFRAVENRIPVVRAANTGLSCFISPEGRILDTVSDKGEEIFVTGHKSYDLVLRKTSGFYARYGNVFLVCAAFLCVLAYRDRRKQTNYSKI